MKLTAGGNVLVKASGGVRAYDTALSFLRIGVDRIGTSSGVAIVAGEVAANGGGASESAAAPGGY